MENYRRFERLDWECYAGAEKFSNGSEPFIYEREINNGACELVIIADKNGIQISLLCEDFEDNTWLKELPMTSIKAEGEIKHLISDLEELTYAPDISYALDHSSYPSTTGFVFNC